LSLLIFSCMGLWERTCWPVSHASHLFIQLNDLTWQRSVKLGCKTKRGGWGWLAPSASGVWTYSRCVHYDLLIMPAPLLYGVCNTLTLKAQIPLRRQSDFHRNFPAGTVANTNHFDMLRCLRQSLWQVCDKRVSVAVVERIYSVTRHRESRRQNSRLVAKSS